MWRARDKLRKVGILVTEDSTARLLKLQQEQQQKQQQPPTQPFNFKEPHPPSTKTKTPHTPQKQTQA